MSGPIYVEGAERGDTLVVDINEIEMITEKGISWVHPEFEPLSSTLLKIPPVKVIFCPIKNGKVHIKDEVPLRPAIGAIATSPENEALSSGSAGKSGGNLDVIDICSGNKIFLPVNEKGAFLYVGDVHAMQGDGELTAVDVPAESTLTVNLIKGKKSTGLVSNHQPIL